MNLGIISYRNRGVISNTAVRVFQYVLAKAVLPYCWAGRPLI